MCTEKGENMANGKIETRAYRPDEDRFDKCSSARALKVLDAMPDHIALRFAEHLERKNALKSERVRKTLQAEIETTL
jgi:hypothetical protein